MLSKLRNLPVKFRLCSFRPIEIRPRPWNLISSAFIHNSLNQSLSCPLAHLATQRPIILFNLIVIRTRYILFNLKHIINIISLMLRPVLRHMLALVLMIGFGDHILKGFPVIVALRDVVDLFNRDRAGIICSLRLLHRIYSMKVLKQKINKEWKIITFISSYIQIILLRSFIYLFNRIIIFRGEYLRKSKEVGLQGFSRIFRTSGICRKQQSKGPNNQERCCIKAIRQKTIATRGRESGKTKRTTRSLG